MRKKILLLITAFVVFNILPTADTLYDARDTDRAILQDVVVIKETYKEIHYYFKRDSNRTQQKISWSRIGRIERDEDKISQDYLLAEGFFEKGNYQQAIAVYKREAQKGGWSKQHSLFKMAECYRLTGNMQKAVSAYNVLNRSVSDNVYLPLSYYNMGLCFANAGIWRNGASAFQRANALYKKVGDNVKAMEASFQQAFCAEKIGNVQGYKLALQSYRQLANQRQVSEIIAQKAKARIGSCLLGLKKYDEAQSHLEKIIEDKDITDRETLSAAYIGMGDYYFSSRSRDVKKALFCYLRVIMLYPNDLENTRRAYDQAAYCFRLLNDRAREKSLLQRKP